MGWSCQKPERRARERDEKAIATWRKERWVEVEKSRANGWPIVFIDESGFMLQPVVRRTWAPRGKPPVHYSWDRHDRLSVIAGITVSPVRCRPGLCFRIHTGNINFEKVIEFIILLRRHLGRKFILVLDRLSAHRKAVRLLQGEHPNWFEVEWLPAYAPDLNPTELVWNHSKYGDSATFALWRTAARGSRCPAWDCRPCRRRSRSLRAGCESRSTGASRRWGLAGWQASPQCLPCPLCP